MTHVVKIPSVLKRLNFVFEAFGIEAFQFPKFYEDVAKLDKSNLRETNLNVTFKVQNL